MSRTIKAIERHMILPVWSQGTATVGRLCQTPFEKRRLTETAYNMPSKLVAEWQRGFEVLGHAQRKLRLAFAPTQSPALATLSH